MDIEVSLLQVNVEKISLGTCRNSQGKCSHDSSAAQHSPGTSDTTHACHSSQQPKLRLLKLLSPALTPAHSVTERWLCPKVLVLLLLGQLRASPAERLSLCSCPSRVPGSLRIQRIYKALQI